MSKQIQGIKKIFVNGYGSFQEGEIWYDHAGNECYYRANGTISCRTINNEPSLTIQSEKDSCDINKIVEKYTKTGQLTNIRTDKPMYGDFSSAVDFHDAVLRAQKAKEAFMDLPSSIRARFSNDPGKLIDFLNDPKNRSEAIELGLVVSPQASQVPQGDNNTPSLKSDKIEKEGV